MTFIVSGWRLYLPAFQLQHNNESSAFCLKNTVQVMKRDQALYWLRSYPRRVLYNTSFVPPYKCLPLIFRSDKLVPWNPVATATRPWLANVTDAGQP